MRVSQAYLGALVCMLANSTPAQTTQATNDLMRQHYDAAFRLQSAGHIPEAEAEHKLFLAEALHHIANGRANIGYYAEAVPVYEQALQLSPRDATLHLEYAEAALDADEAVKAKSLAEKALQLLPGTRDERRAKVLFILARALWAAGDRKQSIEQYKAAAAMSPRFEYIYALATIHLSLSDKESAARLFAEIQSRFGDTATIHMQFGRAYAITTNYPEAVVEFKKAVAKDPDLRGLHYSLGAVYMQRSGAKAYPEAEAEFRKELAIQPNDPLTYPQLGRIALDRHDLKEAEFDLTRADQLDPGNPDTLTILAELYTEQGRRQDTESVLRKAIAATIDPARHRYEIERVHYKLGHMLIEDGSLEEGKKEMQISADLLAESRAKDESSLNGAALAQPALQKTHSATPAEAAEEKQIEANLGPAIASSYDNLGVQAAMASDFAAAANYFKQTATWNPTLAGVDHNWGQAAYEAHQFAEAVGPLRCYLDAHPQDGSIRAMLGISQYMTHDYANALQTLQPLQGDLSFSPMLELAYAESMVVAGDLIQGTQRLQTIIQVDPENAAAHRALAEAYRKSGQIAYADREEKISRTLMSSDALNSSNGATQAKSAAKN